MKRDELKEERTSVELAVGFQQSRAGKEVYRGYCSSNIEEHEVCTPPSHIYTILLAQNK